MAQAFGHIEEKKKNHYWKPADSNFDIRNQHQILNKIGPKNH
jgi:hypothetical protein